MRFPLPLGCSIHRGSLRMRVGVPGGNIVFVQRFGGVQQWLDAPQGFGQGVEQDRNRIYPRNATRFLDHRFDGFFGTLLSGKTSPLIVAGFQRMTSVVQITSALFHPVRVSTRHVNHHLSHLPSRFLLCVTGTPGIFTTNCPFSCCIYRPDRVLFVYALCPAFNSSNSFNSAFKSVSWLRTASLCAFKIRGCAPTC